MTRLIERLEAATEPSRELDAEIFAEVRGIAGAETFMMAFGLEDIPEYTSSLDAALTLVSEGQEWSLVFWPPRKEKAAIPTIALCIAALRGREAGPFDAYQWLRPDEQGETE